MDHKLKKFITVVELQSFTLAANRMHISQPALSMAIASLENELGSELIIRGGGLFRLSKEGEQVYETARRMRLELDNLRQQLGQDRVSRVGMIDSIALMLMRKTESFEKLKVDPLVDNSVRLIESVVMDRLDAGFITEPLTSIPSDITFDKVGYERFLLVAHPKQAINVKSDLKRGRLEHMATHDQSSTTFARIDRHLHENNIGFSPGFFSSSPELIKSWVLKGRGPALLPSINIEDELKSNALVNIDLPGLGFRRPILFIRRDNKYLSPSLKFLIQAVSKQLK